MLIEITITGKYRVPGQAVKVATYEAGAAVDYPDTEYAQWLIDNGYATLPQDADGLKIVTVPESTPESAGEPAGANLEREGKIGKSRKRK